MDFLKQNRISNALSLPLGMTISAKRGHSGENCAFCLEFNMATSQNGPEYEQGFMSQFYCPKCAHPVEVGDDHVGASVLCPGCQHRVDIPDKETPLPSSGSTRPNIPIQTIKGLSKISLIVSVVSILFSICCQPVGGVIAIIGIILGTTALIQGKNPNVSPEGKDLALGGIVLGVVSLLLSIALGIYGYGLYEAEVKEEENQKMPSSIKMSEFEYSRDLPLEIIVTSRVASLTGPINIDGTLHVEIFTWDQTTEVDPNPPRPLDEKTTRLLKKSFFARAMDQYCDGNHWTFRKTIRLPSIPEGDYLAVRFTFEASSIPKVGTPGKGSRWVEITEAVRIK